jgi:hypothetical protein
MQSVVLVTNKIGGFIFSSFPFSFNILCFVFVPGHFVQQSLVLSLPTVLMGSPLVLPNFPSCSLSCWIEVSWLWCKLDHYLSCHQRCSRRLAAIVIVIVIHFTTILARVRGNGYSGRGWKRVSRGAIKQRRIHG